MNFFKAKLDELDSEIRRGQSEQVRFWLSQINPNDIPRPLRAKTANLALRARLGGLALKILNPLVRPKARVPVSASPDEIAEYALALGTIGAQHEALSLLKTQADWTSPNVHLYLGFISIWGWDYYGAIPHLKKFMELTGRDSYWYSVARSNLCAALIFVDSPESESLIHEIKESAKKAGSDALFAYSCRLHAEWAFNRGDLSLMKRELETARKIGENISPIERLILMKWEIIAEISENPFLIEQAAFRKVRDEATRLKHWETVRSLDFHAVLSSRDVDRAALFCRGTPYPSLHSKLKAGLGTRVWPSPEVFLWNPNRSLFELTRRDTPLDWLERLQERVRGGTVLTRLAQVLLSDFYRPLRMAEIHSALFPGQYFNPSTSSHRVAQIVNRLRKTDVSLKLPVAVIEDRGSYRVSLPPRIALVVDRESAPQSMVDVRLERVRAAFAERDFTVPEVSAVLGIHISSAKRFLKSALESGFISRSGSGSRVRYHFIPSASSVEKAA